MADFSCERVPVFLSMTYFVCFMSTETVFLREQFSAVVTFIFHSILCECTFMFGVSVEMFSPLITGSALNTHVSTIKVNSERES